MPSTIPLTSEPSQTFSVELESIIYQFRVIYNQRYGTWSADLSDVAGTLLIGAIPLLIGPDLLRQYTLEIGGLFMFDIEEEKLEDATGADDDLGTRVVLVHYTEDELLTL